MRMVAARWLSRIGPPMALLALLPALLIAQGSLSPAYPNVPYVPGGDERQTLDVYLPLNARPPLPAVVVLPGSAARRTDEYYVELAEFLTGKGYAVVAADYRQSLPDALYDVACVLAWLHSSAAPDQLDPRRVVLLGLSMGGQLAATLGTMNDPALYRDDCPHEQPASSSVRGVVTLGGAFGTPVDLTRDASRAAYADFSGIKLAQIEAAFDQLIEIPYGEWAGGDALTSEALAIARWFPLYGLDPSDPPFLLIHGADDLAIPPGESEQFAALLDAMGVEATLIVLPRAEHVIPLDDYRTELDDFLRRILRMGD